MTPVTPAATAPDPRTSTGLLARVLREHTARGWDPIALRGVRMEGEPAPPAPSPPAPPAPTPPSPTPPANPPAPPAADLASLQAALDTAKATGQTEALQPLFAAAGVADAEGLQAFITAAVEARNANLSEIEQRELAVAQREAVAAAQLETARAQTRAANVRASLVTAGVPGENVADLVPLVQVADDADQAAIDTAVQAVKAKFPALFSVTALPGAPGNPPGGTPGGGGGVTGIDAGRERARQARKGTENADKGDEPIPGFRRVS